MTNTTLDAIGLNSQAKAERSKFLTKVFGDALRALKLAVKKTDKPANLHLPHAV